MDCVFVKAQQLGLVTIEVFYIELQLHTAYLTLLSLSLLLLVLSWASVTICQKNEIPFGSLKDTLTRSALNPLESNKQARPLYKLLGDQTA